MSTTGARLLVVDDDPDMLRLLSMRLSSAGYQVTAVTSAESALTQLEIEHPQLVLSDVRLPGRDGLALFDEVRKRHPSLPVILLTAHGTIPDAVEATARGVFTYLTKPYDGKELLDKIAQALALGAPSTTINASGADESWRAEIVSRSNRMAEVLAEARMVAKTDASVLLRGDSGAGKELMARAIHRASDRASKPFVAVNCGAIPEALLEAEFFGYRKGAFTGANEDRDGFFQAAAGGTLFLDEIGDLPLAMQSKLLRVIQERAVRPIGAVAEQPVDVRLLSATHKDLGAEVQAGQFRQDLYYRLNVIQIRVPPLRERLEDLMGIAERVLERLARDAGVWPAPRLTRDALVHLSRYPFPGNVRELENMLHRAVALSGGEELDVYDLDLPESVFTDSAAQELDRLPTEASLSEAVLTPVLPAEEPLPKDLARYLDEVERDILVRALEHHRYNRTAAGISLGLSLRQMRYRMARLNVNVGGDLTGTDRE